VIGESAGKQRSSVKNMANLSSGRKDTHQQQFYNTQNLKFLNGGQEAEIGGKSQRVPGSRNNASNLMIEGRDVDARMTY
jgi:hypothetical protein